MVDVQGTRGAVRGGVSAEQLEALFELLDDGVAIHELVFSDAGDAVDYRILRVNPEYELQVGRRRTEIVGKLASEVFGGPPIPYLHEYTAAVSASARARFEVYSAGLERHFSLLVIPLGESAFATVLSDIALRKSQEEALEKGRLAQRALLDNQPHLAWLKDQEGRFLAVNKAFAAACGQPSPDAVIGKTDLDVWPRELAEAYRADDRAVMASGQQKVVEEPIDGVAGTRWFETYKSPVFTADGAVVGTTGVARDVTASKRAEQARLQSERNFAKVFDLSPEPVAVSALSGEILAVNRASCEITGYSREELTAPGNTGFGLWKDPEARARAMEHLEREGRFEDLEFNFVARDGTHRYLRLSGALAEVDGRKVMISAARDVTERRRAEEKAQRAEEERRKLEISVLQAQKLESLGVLAGGIAHDFNNLLTSILGNADLALSELSPLSPARVYLDDIDRVSRRAADLCRQMLAYSGKGRFVIQPLSVNELVSEMAHLLSVSISKRAVIKYDFAANLPSVMADATQLRQVVMNLITNASEAIGDSDGVVTFRTAQLECDQAYLQRAVGDHELRAPGQYVLLQVSDTGCGMDPATMARIFDPFFSTKFTGRGLGLAAVLGIVRGHGGALLVDTEKGQGTTFRVLLPAHEQRSEALSVPPSMPELWKGEGLVLLADDEDSVRSLGRRLLERAGFEVITARDGQEAIDLFREHKSEVRLVVLDMTMPRFDGEACFRELRRLDPQVKVVMTSGYNEQDVVERFVGKGLAGFVQKPYKAADLLPKVRAALLSDAKV